MLHYVRFAGQNSDVGLHARDAPAIACPLPAADTQSTCTHQAAPRVASC